LSFSPEGQPISALQFDIEWDQAVSLKLIPGDGLRQSGKLLYTAQLSPRMLRCLIVGLDREVLPNGEMLRIFVSVDPSASAGTIPIGLASAFAANPEGEPEAIRSTPGTIQISESAIGTPLPQQGVLNAASLLLDPVSPGEIITLLGSFPANPILLFNEIPAPVIYADPHQVNAIVPFGLNLDAPAGLEVRTGDRAIARLSVPVQPATPAIFTQAGTGLGQGAILNEDYTPNSAANPATPGSIIMLFGTGFGRILWAQPAAHLNHYHEEAQRCRALSNRGNRT